MSEAEKYLYHYGDLEKSKKHIKNYLDEALIEYKEYYNKLLNPVDLTNAKISKTNKISNPVQEAVVKIIDTFQTKVVRIECELNQIDKDQQSIINTLEKSDLTSIEKSYIKLRYFKG